MNMYIPFYHVKKSTSKIVVHKGRRANADDGWRGGEGGQSNADRIADEGGSAKS